MQKEVCFLFGVSNMKKQRDWQLLQWFGVHKLKMMIWWWSRLDHMNSENSPKAIWYFIGKIFIFPKVMDHNNNHLV